MKNIKKILCAVLVAATFITTAFAASNTIMVNNQQLDGVSYIVNDGRIMLPVRAICEKLGFTVEYDEPSDTVTLVKLPVTVTFIPTVDGYTFARTAPMKLGVAPILVNDRTYVPVEFFKEIIPGICNVENDVVSISWGEETVDAAPEMIETVTGTCSIKEITDEYIMVADYERGDVMVFITDETLITDVEGKIVTKAELDINSEYTIEYAPAMTMSLPPQVTAVKLTKTANEAKDVVEGNVCEILSEQGKIVAIVIGDKEDPELQTVLNVSENTVFKTADGTVVTSQDVKVDSYIRAITSTMTTLSLPAQKAVFEITIM